jgi:hypothetical protein
VHRSIIQAITVLGLVASLAVGANAQSFDGVYKGTGTLTKILRTGPGTPNCPPTGHKFPIVITVASPTISALNLETNKASSGTIAADGTFSITYGAGFWGGGSGSGPFPVTWSGSIREPRIKGTFVVQNPAGECRGVIAARK